MQIFPAIRRVLCFFGVYYAMTNTYFILKKRYRFRLRYSPLFIKKNFGNDVDRYMPGASEEDKKRALANIGRFARKYHISVAEYFYLHFDEKTPEERAAFLSEYDRMIQSKLANKRKFNRVFKNKYECSKLFAPYYKRECLQLVLPSEADKLEAFVEKYGAAIVKPTFSYGGRGIEKVAKIDGNAKMGVDAYLAGLEKGKESKCIVEELIVQDERMARVHPASVNTLRMYTFKLKDRVEIFDPAFRMGCGGMIVDNGASGGIFCAIDPCTGVTLAAADENGNFFTEHPDSHENLIGIQIPCYDEAVAFVKELAEQAPISYVGWDLALSEKGWVLVEANNSAMPLSQIATQVGCKKRFLALMKEARA